MAPPAAIKITTQKIRRDLPSPPLSACSHSDSLRISIPNLINHDSDSHIDIPFSSASYSPNPQSLSTPSPGLGQSLFNKLADWTIESAPLSSQHDDSDEADSEMLDASDFQSFSSSDNSSSSTNSPRIAHPLSPGYLGLIPASQTTQKLAEYGDTYLYEVSTADAFIRAAPMRNSNSESPEATSVVRVKIIPQDSDRKPFYMQKHFPPRGIKVVPEAKQEQSGWEHDTLPIHIEYALYKVPLLAAVLLSGHVRKGDTMVLPMPYPRAWRNAVEWIYRGGELESQATANLDYLGGRI